MNTKLSPAELARQFGPQLYQRAAEKGLTLTAYLNRYENTDPNDKSGLDVFDRVLREAGIVSNGVPEMGIWPSEYGDFDRSPQMRAMSAEWMLRQWRKVSLNSGKRNLFMNSDAAAGDWARPYADAQMARWDQQVAPAIPLSAVVGVTTPITGDVYRAYYLTHSASEVRKVRVGEGAEIPRMKLTGGDRTIDLYKYGRVIEATYEELRRQRLNKVSMIIQRAAVQAEIDKVATVLDVMVNGDGSSGTPTTHDLTTLDSAASAGTLTLKGWLAFKMKFANPYMIMGALMQEAVALQLALLNTGSANIPLVAANLGNLGTGVAPINQFADSVRYGWTSDAPALKIVGFDPRFAIERVTEIGADISEIERFTTKQTQTLTMTEVEGFALMDVNAVEILDVNA
ncbi:MAG: hypothetical protein KDE59_14685 [Anaerolineales bacterium]|nr:hypothetical protein [Anaerolineales bacterium]